ncbi:hypothetical protein INR49_000850 [Caranx melampygus]|nr:hypothetical protein INR49_000850 [Caranx melampygus]
MVQHFATCATPAVGRQYSTRCDPTHLYYPARLCPITPPFTPVPAPQRVILKRRRKKKEEEEKEKRGEMTKRRGR